MFSRLFLWSFLLMLREYSLRCSELFIANNSGKGKESLSQIKKELFSHSKPNWTLFCVLYNWRNSTYICVQRIRISWCRWWCFFFSHSFASTCSLSGIIKPLHSCSWEVMELMIFCSIWCFHMNSFPSYMSGKAHRKAVLFDNYLTK